MTLMCSPLKAYFATKGLTIFHSETKKAKLVLGGLLPSRHPEKNSVEFKKDPGPSTARRYSQRVVLNTYVAESFEPRHERRPSVGESPSHDKETEFG